VGLPESLATEITEKVLRKTSKNSVYSVAYFFLAYALLRDFPDMTARVDEASGSHTPRTIHRTVQQFHAARC